jgi:hypothetical protein
VEGQVGLSRRKHVRYSLLRPGAEAVVLGGTNQNVAP